MSNFAAKRKQATICFAIVKGLNSELSAFWRKFQKPYFVKQKQNTFQTFNSMPQKTKKKTLISFNCTKNCLF